jgi:hypothetical protein
MAVIVQQAADGRRYVWRVWERSKPVAFGFSATEEQARENARLEHERIRAAQEQARLDLLAGWRMP